MLRAGKLLHACPRQGVRCRAVQQRRLHALLQLPARALQHKERAQQRRVLQSLRFELEIFRTRSRGWGLRSLTDIPAHAFVVRLWWSSTAQ